MLLFVVVVAFLLASPFLPLADLRNLCDKEGDKGNEELEDDDDEAITVTDHSPDFSLVFLVLHLYGVLATVLILTTCV